MHKALRHFTCEVPTVCGISDLATFPVQPAPTTEEEVFLTMFDYMDRLFGMVRPRKLLFMAIGKSALLCSKVLRSLTDVGTLSGS